MKKEKIFLILSKMTNFINLFDLYQKFLIPYEDKLLLLLNFEEFKKIFKSKNKKIYELFYLSKKNLNKILYDNKKLIFLKSKFPEKNLANLFYICLLIKDKPYIINYVYNYNYIKNIYFINQDDKNNLKKFILSLIIIELIDNYKSIEEFYDKDNEEQLKKIYEKTNNIINNFFNENELNLELKKNKIKNKNIDVIYSEILISLIKNEKIQDYEYTVDILNQMDLISINITEKILHDLLYTFNENKDFIKKYLITKFNDLLDINKINFNFIILKYIFKNPIYIYNIPFLFHIRKIILEELRLDSDKLYIININNNEVRKRLEYIIKFVCDSNYYFNKYLSKKNEQLKEVLKYYKTYLFETKKEDIILIENFIKNLNNEIDYEKYLKDYKNVKKIKYRVPIINYLFNEKIEIKSEKNENEIKEIFEKFEHLEKMINDKKLKKMRKDYKIKLDIYFKNKDNKEILLNIFSEDNYKYFINQIDLELENNKID